jgi:hypothetical protein
MKNLTKLCAAALMMGGATIVTAGAADADVGVSFGFGGPGYYGGYYDDYDYYRPCWWYREYDLPAPARCYRYFYDYWGPGIYFDGDFIFRNRDHWWRWHDRDDFRHWRNHDFHWHGDHNWGHGGHDWHHDGGADHHDGGGHVWSHDGDHGGWGGHGDGGHNWGGHGDGGHGWGGHDHH